jgi:hypothetical protein
MSTFNIDNFRTEINRSGIAKSNRFELQIYTPASLQSFANESRIVNLYCEITNLPGMSISTKGLKLYGPAYQRPISSEFNGEAINMTFYLDQGMNVKAFFDAWMFKTVNPNSFNVSYADQYVSTIKISQLDGKNNREARKSDKETYSVYLEDAFPRAMSLVDLSASAVNQAGRLNMTFAYRRWYSEHPSYKGVNAKTNFNPLTQDQRLPGTDGTGPNVPFRININGTSSSLLKQ